ncbi:DUF349 domain-containing protein [Undibacterium sp. Ren11W]|uniref:DUF349 domain-containing protein n=1 Tax=Undibacterium sp. Ren11W TaxID=3413045 RepID=UPI003BEF7E24
MFDFLAKLLFRRPRSLKNEPAAKIAAQSANAIVAQQQAETKKHQLEQARAASLAKMTNLDGNEAAAIELLLACDFADGRLQAAQHVHSQAGLEQVRAAMLKSDKRVVKLMQSRLDVIAQAGKQEQLAQLCLEEASHLVQLPHLIANQVSDLDKRQAAVQFPAHLLTQFSSLRQQLESKLLAQTALQRRVLDLLAQLNQAGQSQAVTEQADAVVDSSDEEMRLAAWQQELDQCQQKTEAASLPKNILADAVSKLQTLQSAWKSRQQALQAAQQKEQQKQEKFQQNRIAAELSAASAATENNPEPSATAAAALEVEPQAAEAERKAARREAKDHKDKPASTLSKAQIVAAIEALTEALALGSIQTARKLDRELRGVDAKHAGLSAEQKDQLFEARSELVYLQGWAKWGGDVSRDELIKTLDEMPALELGPNELAKKVATLRERWKEMEASSGAASKELWERFDAACHLAYAPAALHFQQQAEQRKANLDLAEAALSTLQSNAAELLQGVPDWKKMANFCMQSQQDWKKLGHVDRKHKGRLDAAFDGCVQGVQQALDQRRAEEVLAREGLIAEVLALDPMQRSTTDQLKALQQRWQAQAAAVPLRRKDEQVLWDKYRAACDALFAQRKQASGEADAQRKENLASKLALCEVLEQAGVKLDGNESNIKQLLQQTAADWRNAGPVPRADEEALEQRYQQALASLKQHSQTLQDQQKQLSHQLNVKKLSLCQQAEQLLVLTPQDARIGTELSTLQSAWDSLQAAVGGGNAKLSAKLNAILQTRFQNAIAALTAGDTSFAAALKNNASEFDASLLQLEILFGIDSPAELARERLQMQVEVLQNSLKRGSEQDAASILSYRLLSLPVLTSTANAQRLEEILAASAVL